MEKEKYIILIVLNTVNVFIHTLGFYLLLATAKKGFRTVQQVVLLNLAATAVVVNITRLIQCVLFLI